jgi:hypothetical protein
MTSGFYKPENNTFLYAPNKVSSPTYQLIATSKDQYTYPNNGWVWCDSIEEAIEDLNIKLPSYATMDDYYDNTDADYPFIILDGVITKV